MQSRVRRRRLEERIMMSRRSVRWPSVVTVLGLAGIAVGLSGQGAGQPSTRNGEWPTYTADLRGTRYSPLDQINASNFKQARGRLAVQDRQPGPASGVQAGRHAAHGEGRALRDRRHAALGGGARRKNRRADLGAQPARRHARRDRPAAAVGPRRVVLDRRQGRRTHPVRDHRIPAGRAQREERRDDPVVRQGRHRRSEGRRW